MPPPLPAGPLFTRDSAWLWPTSRSQVGKVLRVRKPRPPQDAEQAALEEAVWAPVLGPSTAATNAAGAAAAREQAYVQQLLAPLLGQHHVPHQEPVQTSPSFLRRLLVYSGCLPSGGNGLDFAAAAAAEKSEVAPGVASLMPDVTLLSDSSPTAPPGSGAALSPAVCIELKPKCGFIGGGGATVHPDNRPIKRSRSRFQLHQMLKLAEVGGTEWRGRAEGFLWLQQASSRDATSTRASWPVCQACCCLSQRALAALAPPSAHATPAAPFATLAGQGCGLQRL